MKLQKIIRKIARMLPWIWLIKAAVPFQGLADGPLTQTQPGCVILLHGLGRTADSMESMSEALEKAGLTAINLDYPSRDYTVEKLAMDTIARGIDLCAARGADKIHFVTHSMGGILLRYYLTRQSIKNLGRVVMLSPPNQGSELVDALKDNPFFRWYNGPAGQQIGTGPDGLIAGLGPVNYPVGIITGNKHAFFDGWFSSIIQGEDDGKVSVEGAKVAGMADFLVLPYAHPFIMEEKEVITQTIHFLCHGTFQRPSGRRKIKQSVLGAFNVMQAVAQAEKRKHQRPDICFQPEIQDLRLLESAK